MNREKIFSAFLIIAIIIVLIALFLVQLVPEGIITESVSPYPPESGCTDSDGGKNYYVKGTVTYKGKYYSDSCISNIQLREYYCSDVPFLAFVPSTRGKIMRSTTFNCKRCVNGACIKEITTTLPPTCTDSDGGLNYETYGITKIRYDEEYDYCKSSSILIERYCEGNKFRSREYKCPSGCKNGVCIKLTSTCTDSDGGKNYYVKGTTKGTDPDTLGFVEITDQCRNSNQLYEYFCNYMRAVNGKYGYYFASVMYDCPSGYTCSNGACLRYL